LYAHADQWTRIEASIGAHYENVDLVVVQAVDWLDSSGVCASISENFPKIQCVSAYRVDADRDFHSNVGGLFNFAKRVAGMAFS
jgi:hypothetical protein